MKRLLLLLSVSAISLVVSGCAGSRQHAGADSRVGDVLAAADAGWTRPLPGERF